MRPALQTSARMLVWVDTPCRRLQEKITPTSGLAAHRCCRDVANPCKVPAFPPDTDLRRTDTLSDYGPNSLFWPYGGSGTFISAGLAVDVVGPDGWALCARMFVKMNTDVQVKVGCCLFNPSNHPAVAERQTCAAAGLVSRYLELRLIACLRGHQVRNGEQSSHRVGTTFWARARMGGGGEQFNDQRPPTRKTDVVLVWCDVMCV